MSTACSFCGTPDGHPRADPGAGRGWNPLPGLPHLRYEGPLSWYRGPPSAEGDGGTGQYATSTKPKANHHRPPCAS